MLVDKGLNRSAYLMMYISLEVATKSLISFRKPDTKWLINNIPSPDLYKLYTDFIHKEIAEILDKDSLGILRDISTKRNQLAHQGAYVREDILRKHLRYINLWMKKIDYEMGYKWSIVI